MTEQIEQPEQADAVDQADAPEQPEQAEETKGGNAEAAKLRHQRNEARSERDQLAVRVEAMEQAQLDYALGAANLDRRLWDVSEQDLDTYRDAAGNLDLPAVIDAARSIRADLGLAGPRPNPQQGLPSGPVRGGLEAAFDYRLK